MVLSFFPFAISSLVVVVDFAVLLFLLFYCYCNLLFSIGCLRINASLKNESSFKKLFLFFYNYCLDFVLLFWVLFFFCLYL